MNKLDRAYLFLLMINQKRTSLEPIRVTLLVLTFRGFKKENIENNAERGKEENEGYFDISTVKNINGARGGLVVLID